MRKKQELQLQEMVRFSKRTLDWKPIEPTKKMPYDFKSSLNGLDIYIGCKGIMHGDLFTIGIFNGESVVGETSVAMIYCREPPEIKALMDYHDSIKKANERIGRSCLSKPRYLKRHQEEDIRRVRRALR